MTELIQELKKFKKTKRLTPKAEKARWEKWSDEKKDFVLQWKNRQPNHPKYWWADDQCFQIMDYNKEILHPCPTEPNGLLGIRFDDNFWLNAVLPYKFVGLSIGEIVSVLWPKQNVKLMPDYVVPEKEFIDWGKIDLTS